MTKKIIFLIFGLLLAAGGYYAYRDFWQADAQPRQGAPGRPGGPGAGPIPVVAAAASKGEVAVIMNGLGTATPLRTVTVRKGVAVPSPFMMTSISPLLAAAATTGMGPASGPPGRPGAAWRGCASAFQNSRYT